MATVSGFSGHSPVDPSMKFLDFYNSEGPKGPVSPERSYTSLTSSPTVHEYEETLGFTLGDSEGFGSFMSDLFGVDVKIERGVALLSGVSMGDITSTLNANLPAEVSFTASAGGGQINVTLVPKEVNIQNFA